MDTVRVITAADSSMRDWAARCLASARQCGYKTHRYNLQRGKWQASPSDLQFADGFAPCTFKPRIIRDALTHWPIVIYLDADCIMQRNLGDALSDRQYDIAVTERREPEVHPKAGKINTGVLAVRNNRATRSLLAMWAAWADVVRSEQQALNNLLDVADPQLKVLRLPCVRYNNYYFDGTEKTAAVVHYKSDVRHHWREHE